MIKTLVALIPLYYGGHALTRVHQRWADDTAVPDWVKSQCCGPADAHRLRPDQVHAVEGGFYVDGYDEGGVPKKVTVKPLPSPDGESWIFYRRYDDGSLSTVYCFFGPAGA